MRDAVSRIWTFFVSRISLRNRGAFYAVPLAQRAASLSVNSLVMRLTTKVAPDSTSEASRPEISTCASMGTADEPGSCPATTLKVIAVFTRVPPWSSLLREDTCPVIAVPSSSSATSARKVTLAGPNFTVRAASYEPSSSPSPSLAPGMHSTTARGSDSTSQTIRGAAGTSTRSLISITMWTGKERAPGCHCFCAFVAMNSYSVPNSRPKPLRNSAWPLDGSSTACLLSSADVQYSIACNPVNFSGLQSAVSWSCDNLLLIQAQHRGSRRSLLERPRIRIDLRKPE